MDDGDIARCQNKQNRARAAGVIGDGSNWLRQEGWGFQAGNKIQQEGREKGGK